MKKLGELRGSGQLLLGDREAPASYRITVWTDEVRKWADGEVRTPTFGDLFDAFSQGGVRLRLEDGEEVDVIVSNAAAGGVGDMKVSGPVPGF